MIKITPEESYCFQYASCDGRVFEDTGLINKWKALCLWEEYIPLFKEHFQKGLEPEMAIWRDMRNETDYHTKLKHLCAGDCKMVEGKLYELIIVG